MRVFLPLVVQQAGPLVAAGQGHPPVVLSLARQFQVDPEVEPGIPPMPRRGFEKSGAGTMADAEVTNPNAISSSIASSVA